MGMYAIFNQKSLLNLAAGIFANAGSPWTDADREPTPTAMVCSTRVLTAWGATRETGPGYVDLDLRWGHDFAITANKADEAPRLGFSAGAFNVLNHVNGQGIDTVETSRLIWPDHFGRLRRGGFSSPCGSSSEGHRSVRTWHAVRPRM